MHFEEVDAGDFRIFAGAIEKTRRGGYVAAVVVVRQRGDAEQDVTEEAYRDESLAGGFVWPTPSEALRFAISAGRDAVMCRSGRLAA